MTALEQCRCNSDMQERNPACPVHGHKASKPKTHADELRGLAVRDSASWDYVQSAMRSAADELDRLRKIVQALAGEHINVDALQVETECDLGVEDDACGDDIDCPTCGQGHTGPAARALRKRLTLKTSAELDPWIGLRNIENEP